MTLKCPECDTNNPDTVKFCGECGTSLPSFKEMGGTRTIETPRDDLTRGTMFAGRYEIIEELGSGGMGAVFRVQDKKLNEEVALKLIKPEIASDKKTLERFSQELKIARKIIHRNVGRMYELMEENGRYFISMEYVAGQDLRRLLKQTKQLALSTVVSIGRQVCDGLAEAHRLGVVHRDLKPANIMIDREGQARIMDFGIARSVHTKSVTGEGVVIGTPEYMSPEQVEGKPVDQRSDLYSLGVILYEMVTGHVPFEGDTPLSVALKQKNEAPQSPRQVNAQVPDDLSRLILKCLEKDREKRFQTAEELAAELAMVENDLPTTERKLARKETSAQIVRKRIRSLRIPGIILLSLFAVLGGFYLLNRTRAPKKATAPPAVSTPWKNSIAVLPFRDNSPRKDQEGICDGMTEAIIVRLSQLQDLKVTGANSVMHYKNTGKDVRQIGTELGVMNVVDGAIQREENRIRITAQLIAKDNQFVLWSKEYERELSSIFSLQDEISGAIAEALKVKLVPGMAEASGKDRPANLEAYEYCTKGMSFIKSKYVLYFKEEDFRMGIAMFDNAIRLDPNYSLPYFGIGWAYEYHYQVTGNKSDAEMVQKSAETAWRLDPSSALNNAVLGYAVYEYGHEFDRAFGLFQKALDINPNLGDVNFVTGMGYLYHGLYQEGIRYLTKALELDPYNFWTPYKLAYCYMYSGEFDKADFNFRKYFELAPIEPLVYPGRYIALNIMMKRYDQAEESVERGEKTVPKADWVKKYRALLFAVKGEKDKALALYRDSDVYSVLGLKDEAFQALGQEIRKSRMVPYIFYQDFLHNPFYDKLRGDPRFPKLVEQEKKLYDDAIKRYGR